MRGKGIPWPGRGFRMLVECHSWDGTSAVSNAGAKLLHQTPLALFA